MQSIISVNTNILLRRFRLKFLRIMYSTSCYKEHLNFENTLYRLRITDQLFKSYVLHEWCVHNRLFNAYYEVKFKKTPDIFNILKQYATPYTLPPPVPTSYRHNDANIFVVCTHFSNTSK
jgi:hypothetical protein